MKPTLDYLVIDLETGAGTRFETMSEARGCIAYDHLTRYQIWRLGVCVDSTDHPISNLKS
jgi:hypothetical protein